MPIIFQNVRYLFLELFFAEAALNVRYQAVASCRQQGGHYLGEHLCVNVGDTVSLPPRLYIAVKNKQTNT